MRHPTVMKAVRRMWCVAWRRTWRGAWCRAAPGLAPRIAVAAVLCCTGGAMAGDECAPAWVAFGGGGMNHMVRALAVFDDGTGSGPALYAGGQFTMSDGVQTNGIAKWNGTSWSPLGTGVAGSGSLLGVRALAVFDDGNGSGPALYAGGQFSSIDGVPANGIAKWNGSAWSPVGNGQMGPVNSIVNALAVYDDGLGGGPALYAGGSFTSIGDSAALRIARWSGSAWSALSGGVNSGVHALAVHDSGGGGPPALIASGIFVNASGSTAVYIAAWNGTAWSALANTSVGLGIYSLAVFDDGLGGGPALYAGAEGNFTGQPSMVGIARWTGSAWASVGGGVNGGVYSLGVFDDGTGGGPALYAGGTFSAAGGVPAAGVARWSGTSWSGLGGGANSTVFAFKEFDNGSGAGPALYVGGAFQMVDGVPAKSIAKWQGCPAPPCAAADIDCDGAVNGFDLGLLLASWGPCSGCAADLNGDGAVDGFDLGALLSAWGVAS